MDTKQRISAILRQKNYQVVKGKVLRYDQLEDKFKPVPVTKDRIPLVKDGSIVEVFIWSDVAACIADLHGNGKPPEAVVDDLPMKIIRGKNTIVGNSAALNTKIDYKATSKDAFEGNKLLDLVIDEATQYDINPQNLNMAKGMIEAGKNKPKSNKMTKSKKLKAAKKALKVATKKTTQLKKKKASGKNPVSISEKDVEFITSEHKKGTSRMQIAKLLSGKKKQEVSRHLVMYHINKLSKK